MNIVSLRLVVAAMLAAIGVVGFIIGLGYEFGSMRRMGPGYFPVVLSAILVVLSVADGVTTYLKSDPNDQPGVDWRPMCAILAAVAGFALTIWLFGLLPAFLVVIGLATLSERRYGLVPALIISLVTCLGAWLLFSQLLGMTLPLLRWGL